MSLLKNLEELAEESFKEVKTTEFICKYLVDCGIKNFINCNPGVIGTIDINKDKTIALRADIDALPLDKDKIEFKHMCGHHAHTAILLKFLDYANQNRENLKYNIRFIFQPAEEIGKGAKYLINKGCLKGVDEIYAIHVEPVLKLGEVGLKKGYLLAGAKFFDLEINGKSTHAALPHNGMDVFVVFSELLNKIQTIISRFKDPVKSAVFSIGKVEAGYAHNIIPDKIKISGTFRFFEDEISNLLEKKFIDALESLKSFYGINYELNYLTGTVPLKNDERLVGSLIESFKNSEFKVVTNIYPMMGSEDFAFYLQKVPGVFIRFGIRVGDYHPPLHNRNFYVSEKVVELGVKLWRKIFF